MQADIQSLLGLVRGRWFTSTPNPTEQLMLDQMARDIAIQIQELGSSLPAAETPPTKPTNEELAVIERDIMRAVDAAYRVGWGLNPRCDYDVVDAVAGAMNEVMTLIVRRSPVSAPEETPPPSETQGGDQ